MKAQRSGGGGIVIIIFVIIALIALFYISRNGSPNNSPKAQLTLSPSGTVNITNNTYSESINLTVKGLSNNNNTVYQVKVSSPNPTDVYVVYAINDTSFTQFNTYPVTNGYVGKNFYQIKIYGKNTVGAQLPLKFVLNFTLYHNNTIENNQELNVQIN